MAPQVKIIRMVDATNRAMNLGRGTSLRLVGPDDGARNVDVHVNYLNVDSGKGEYHYHKKAENVYVVLDGLLEVTIEGERYLMGPGDVGFIPPGLRHWVGNAGDKVACLLEIYAPAGHDFNVVDPPESETDVERVVSERVHLGES